MPTASRKSSLGTARRGPQKAHIPYRGDNPEVGKKTGIAVQHVERKSDGFELFDEVMQAADGLTPPQRKARRKSLAAERYEDDYDEEDGEQSMQIDSPVKHLMDMAPPVSPPTIRRRSSFRPIARTSDVDFDQIPSPRPMNSFHRSVRNGAGPSTLSQTGSHQEPEPEPFDSPNEAGGEYGGGDEDHTMFEEPSREENSSPRNNIDRRTSFTQIDQDDDEEEEEDREPTPRPSRKQKGKERAIDQDQDAELENGIAQGLEDVDHGPESDASQERPPVKTSKKSTEPGNKPSKSHKQKENRPYREGTRRSQRKTLKPLAYWRGERYVYGRPEDQSGPVLVPPIREVIRIPEEPAMPLGGKRKRGISRTRSKSRGVERDEEMIPPALPVENPEEGWDDGTNAKCVVLQYNTLQEVERRIAWTARMVQPKMATTNNWAFDKVFHDDEFIAAGQLVIPPKGRKPSKQAKDNTYVFYVIEGAVNFKIHDTSMILATGGMFMVPRGNDYFIENICNRDARLFFTQARKVKMTEEEQKSKEKQAAEAAEGQRKRLSGRSSSARATPSARIQLPNGRAASLAFPTS